MPNYVEVDEAQLAQYRVLQDFVSKGLSNPKTRKLIKAAERELYPDRAVPEEDAKAEVMARVDQLEERLAAQERERNQGALTRQWQTGQAAARKAGYTDEGLQDLEKFMEERGVFDHELAIPAFERLHPPPEPTTVGSAANWNLFDIPKDGPDMQMLMEGRDEEFLAKTIPQVLKDVRGRR
ncbi:MAG: hypothetical protein ACREFA_08335 [Stellaceae bacterium]